VTRAAGSKLWIKGVAFFFVVIFSENGLQGQGVVKETTTREGTDGARFGVGSSFE
jgi:hypothetical protein